jgi:hypothetical protein
MRSSLAVVLALAVHPVGAQMHKPPAAIESVLAPGAFDELCFELSAGQSMRYTFDADAPLDFNIHWHRGKDVLFPVKIGAVARLGSVFRSSDKQPYCLMWTNRARVPVALRARIDRGD